MQAKKRLLFVGAIAAVAMAMGVTSASANRLSLNHTAFRAVFAPLRLRSSGVDLSACNVTFEGSFHASTFQKVSRTLIGVVNRASVTGCTTGGETVLAETLPWHLTYRSFTGTLPRITGMSINLVGYASRLRSIMGECLLRSSAEEPAVFIAERSAEGQITGLRADTTATIRCGLITSNFEGTAAVTENPGGGRFTLTLI